MKNRDGHISMQQMQDYLQGKLNSAEMHVVEKHLLECEFCQDAMEGLESTDTKKISEEVSVLSEEINQRMIAYEKNRPSRFKHSWIAAIISLVLVASYFLLFEILPPGDIAPKTNIAQEDILGDQQNLTEPEESPIKPIPKVSEEKDQPGSSDQLSEELLSSQDVAESQAPTDEKKTEEQLPDSYSKLDNSRIKEEIANENPIVQSAPPQSSENTQDFSREDSGSDELLRHRESLASHLPPKGAPQASSYLQQANEVVVGKVINAENHAPIPGVNILLNSNSGVVSDQEGNFKLPVDDNLDKITFSSIGYKTEERTLNGKDSLMVEMQPDTEALSETVVIGYGKKSKSDLSTSRAYPVIGMKQFREYLKEEIEYPVKARENRVEGTVILSFDILANGKLANIQVAKGLGYGCDEEAIRLLKEGPKWQPAQKDGQAIDQHRTLKISFQLP